MVCRKFIKWVVLPTAAVAGVGYLALGHGLGSYISTAWSDATNAVRGSVPVDFELRGCPVSQRQLVEVVRALVAGRRPRIPTHSVCLECKRQGNVCVAVAQDIPCLGPVTQAGCGAICPSYDRGCYGCFGPAAQANLVSITAKLASSGASPAEVANHLRGMNANAPEFRTASDNITSLQSGDRQ